jgi:hypothetical protein
VVKVDSMQCNALACFYFLLSPGEIGSMHANNCCVLRILNKYDSFSEFADLGNLHFLLYCTVFLVMLTRCYITTQDDVHNSCFEYHTSD